MDEINAIILQAEKEADINWLKAAQTLFKGIEDHPDEPQLYELLANLHFKKRVFRKAANLYDKAMKLESKDVNTVFKIAFCYMMEKDFEKAVAYFDRIADIVPEAAYNKCIALCHLGNTEDAMEALEKMISDESPTEEAYILLSKIYLDLHRYKKAIDLLTLVEKRFQSSGEINYIRGCAYFKKRKWLPAYVDFSKAEGFLNSNSAYYRMYAISAEFIGKYEKAEALLLKCIRINPRFFPAYFDLIEVYTKHKRYKDAIKIIKDMSKYGLSLNDRTRFTDKFYGRIYNEFRKDM